MDEERFCGSCARAKIKKFIPSFLSVEQLANMERFNSAFTKVVFNTMLPFGLKSLKLKPVEFHWFQHLHSLGIAHHMNTALSPRN